MTSSALADVLRLDRDLPTTDEDIAVLRRLRGGPVLGFEEYLAALAALPALSTEQLRSRPGPAGEPFDLLG